MAIVARMLDFHISIESLFGAKNEVYMLKPPNFIFNTQIWHKSKVQNR